MTQVVKKGVGHVRTRKALLTKTSIQYLLFTVTDAHVGCFCSFLTVLFSFCLFFSAGVGADFQCLNSVKSLTKLSTCVGVAQATIHFLLLCNKHLSSTYHVTY